MANYGLPGSSAGKESVCNAEDLGLSPGSGRSPGEGNGNPLQYPCLENPHGQRNLAGYSPWGHKGWDTTKRLSTAQHNLLGKTAGKFIQLNEKIEKSKIEFKLSCVQVNVKDKYS